MSQRFNDKLALAILIAGALCGVIWSTYVAVAPDSAFASLQAIDVKWLLVVVGDLLVVVMALLLYSRLYFPLPKRVCLTANRAIWGVGIILSALPIGLKQISFNPNTNSYIVEMSDADAGIASAIVFLIIVTGSYGFTKMYFKICEIENNIGKELGST